MSLTSIKKELAAAGYHVEDSEKLMRGRSIICWFSMINEDELNTCCGVREVGGFSLRIGRYVNNVAIPKDKNSLIYKGMMALIIDKFISLKNKYLKIGYDEREETPSLDAVANKNPKIRVTQGIVFATNGHGPSAVIEDALKLIPQHYQAVSKTINPNSGAIITIWVAKF